jgi:(1->4)-alpha-D-glucan 1-alpha-D-glucosylmutase
MNRRSPEAVGRSAPPRATYRVQLHAGFTFDDAAAIVPYLAELGISHLYTSPVLQAVPGSTHGYDVVDHSRVSEELGGEAGFERLTDALRAHGMGLVLDIVPNHMAISTAQNRWWWDLLAHGPASRYAHFFDVDWDPPESRLRNVILLPVLPDHYGRVLEAGEIRLARHGGAVTVRHGDREFPLDPRTVGLLVTQAAPGAGSDELAFIGSSLEDLPPSTSADPEQVARRQRDADVLAGRLDELAADPAVAAALDAVVAARNADVEALDALLEEQNYRLAFWRSASRDLGYRRFFDIDELIGLRMEDETVFAETHALILRWVAEGRVDGLRIDHPDGLRDPAGYFARLRASAPDAWIVAEKILEADEPLPSDWPIDGTTGYRFANLATGLQVDPAGERPLTEAWEAVADVGPGWEEIAAEARASVLVDLLGSDVNRLTELLLAVCEQNRRYRDFTRHELHHALREVAAALPVYRTYVRVRDRHLTERDARLISDAVALAARRRQDLDPELFTFIGRVLRLEVDGPLAGELAMRFQQLTPAAMAKGLEDTAFYRYHRLVALNEVGGDPRRFGTEPGAFHEAMAEAEARWPAAMLALSTHDTKRSADVRARLAMLAGDPDGWRAASQRLAKALRPHRSSAGSPADAEVSLFLQVLVGAWPIDADRLVAYLAKATREAKLHTSWTDPDPEHDAAVERLVRDGLADPAFVALVEDTVAGLVEPGQRAALAQLALQLTAPGVPDTYQGSELWELSLVDPDNRRPVDYDARRALLADARRCSAAEAWARRDEGLPKLWLMHRVLDLRRRRPDALVGGAYLPLEASGAQRAAAVAFMRGEAVVTVVPRLVRSVGREGWQDTTLLLPAGRWRSLDGTDHEGEVSVADLLGRFPVAVLERVA